MCLMIRISMVPHPPSPPPPSPPLTLFHKMSRIADCQCDISCFPLSLCFSPCFCCCFFFLCVSRLCSKYGLCLCVSICVCVSQFVVEIVLLISYECQRWRRRRRRRWWALLGTRFSFRWKQEWFAPSQKLVRCCDPLPPPLPSPLTTLWSPLDRIAVWLEKPQEIFHRQFFKVCLVFWYLVRISFSKLSRTRLHGKQFETTKGSGNKEIQGN